MQQRGLITDALARIGNTNSLPVIELAFNATCENGVDAREGSLTARRRMEIMECLNRLTTKESLQTMLHCLTQAEVVSPDRLANDSYGRDLGDWVERFLSDKDNYGTKSKWHEILLLFPTNNLPATQCELLERVVNQEKGK